MVTLALIAMCGVMGLAVDVGWSFFVRKAARAAADSAALAAANAAMATVGQGGSWNTCPTNVTCGGTLTCSSGVTSIASDNMDNGCLYARQNGFVDGDNGGRAQRVTITGDRGSPPGLGVVAHYWARATVTEDIPQLFSAVLGHTMGTVNTEAVAVVADGEAQGALILTNRIGDVTPLGQGVNLDLQGGKEVVVSGAVIMSSKLPNYAGTDNGSKEMRAEATWINRGGWVENPNLYIPRPVPKDDGDLFYDPMRGKPQPGLGGMPSPGTSAGSMLDCPVTGGTLDGSKGDLTLSPGNYYAVDAAGNPTGQPVKIRGNVRFAARGTANCFAGVAAPQQDPNLFGNYVFYGGLANEAGQVGLTVEPGRYILAGALPGNRLVDFGSNMAVSDLGPVGSINADAGQLFVLTDPNYLGGALGSQISSLPSAVQSMIGNLKMGPAHVQAGSQTVAFSLHGLNPDNPQVKAAGLDVYGPALFWQDRRNATVKYQADGHVVGGNECTGLAGSPCRKLGADLAADGVNGDSTRFHYQGAANSKIFGVLYQPRGSYTWMQGGDNTADQGFLRIITGAIRFEGAARLTMRTPQVPVPRRIVALVQ